MFKPNNVGKKHLERRQPTERKRWGLLEKKKDYKQRAEDYHKKQAHLALLRSKAAAHNEDEFDYGMIRGRTRDGVLVKERETSKVLSNDAVKLMKTQDEGYIRTLENQERKYIERAKNQILFDNSGMHKKFSDAGEATVISNKPSKSTVKPSEEDTLKKLSDLKELKRRVARQRELSLLRQEVDLQRELMKKGSCVKKVDNEGRVSYKWLNVRKR
ncbi:rRNA-processing protein [Starmerella bacillaris]|uniref:U3 small nucleolar RNA-associated protein 11 n=1 Tax=Starmerella bacillaris TaxID=1247836 RepID=A0AAV5REG9_STABA|nr:rRNA-processing protein [Starmerella bacillaris]